MKTITAASGRTRELPEHLDPVRIAGLDPEGRIVVDDFDARNAEPASDQAPFMFGLTLCCDAYDKGVEDGIVCRGCYDTRDVGSYLFREPDGTFPELDPITSIMDD